MDPVVGLDGAKGESQIQRFLDKKKPYKSNVKVSHTMEGLEILLHFLIEIEKYTGVRPPVVLESTGHYHKPIITSAICTIKKNRNHKRNVVYNF